MTSSPGDEVSYFDKSARHTHFTGQLIHLLKNGVENTQEMITLDDMYEHARMHLQEKKFPQPVSKSQLNIPSSQFFIARNPAFSVEQYKRRPAQLYAKGLFQDALLEYDLLLKKYPDDLELRREAERHRTQILLSDLLREGDELFYRHAKYADALNKYRKARQIKPDDDTILHKISMCEAHLAGTTPPVEEHKTSRPEKKVEKPKQEQKKEEEKITVKKEDSNALAGKEAGNVLPAILAIVWMALIAAGFVINGAVGAPPLILAAVFLALTLGALLYRQKKLTKTESLLYLFCVAFLAFIIIASLSDDYELIFPLAVFSILWICGTYAFLRSRVHSFHAIQFILGCIPLVSACMIGTYANVMLYGFENHGGYPIVNGELGAWEFDDELFAAIGFILGGLLSIILIISLIHKWRPKQSSEQKTPIAP
jgi:tetratricopeptide (TPR) repeat protein